METEDVEVLKEGYAGDEDEAESDRMHTSSKFGRNRQPEADYFILGGTTSQRSSLTYSSDSSGDPDLISSENIGKLHLGIDQCNGTSSSKLGSRNEPDFSGSDESEASSSVHSNKEDEGFSSNSEDSLEDAKAKAWKELSPGGSKELSVESSEFVSAKRKTQKEIRIHHRTVLQPLLRRETRQEKEDREMDEPGRDDLSPFAHDVSSNSNDEIINKTIMDVERAFSEENSLVNKNDDFKRLPAPLLQESEGKNLEDEEHREENAPGIEDSSPVGLILVASDQKSENAHATFEGYVLNRCEDRRSTVSPKNITHHNNYYFSADDDEEDEVSSRYNTFENQIELQGDNGQDRGGKLHSSMSRESGEKGMHASKLEIEAQFWKAIAKEQKCKLKYLEKELEKEKLRKSKVELDLNFSQRESRSLHHKKIKQPTRDTAAYACGDFARETDGSLCGTETLTEPLVGTIRSNCNENSQNGHERKDIPLVDTHPSLYETDPFGYVVLDANNKLDSVLEDLGQLEELEKKKSKHDEIDVSVCSEDVYSSDEPVQGLTTQVQEFMDDEKDMHIKHLEYLIAASVDLSRREKAEINNMKRSLRCSEMEVLELRRKNESLKCHLANIERAVQEAKAQMYPRNLSTDGRQSEMGRILSDFVILNHDMERLVERLDSAALKVNQAATSTTESEDDYMPANDQIKNIVESEADSFCTTPIDLLQVIEEQRDPVHELIRGAAPPSQTVKFSESFIGVVKERNALKKKTESMAIRIEKLEFGSIFSRRRMKKLIREQSSMKSELKGKELQLGDAMSNRHRLYEKNQRLQHELGNCQNRIAIKDQAVAKLEEQLAVAQQEKEVLSRALKGKEELERSRSMRARSRFSSLARGFESRRPSLLSMSESVLGAIPDLERRHYERQQDP